LEGSRVKIRTATNQAGLRGSLDYKRKWGKTGGRKDSVWKTFSYGEERIQRKVLQKEKELSQKGARPGKSLGIRNATEWSLASRPEETQKN